MTEPAIVHGNERTAIAVFREDERGNLVDIDFYCYTANDCADFRTETQSALRWPAYSFSPDYDTCCSDCGAIIQRA